MGGKVNCMVPMRVMRKWQVIGWGKFSESKERTNLVLLLACDFEQMGIGGGGLRMERWEAVDGILLFFPTMCGLRHICWVSTGC
jgi:hypothetical protein